MFSALDRVAQVPFVYSLLLFVLCRKRVCWKSSLAKPPRRIFGGSGGSLGHSTGVEYGHTCSPRHRSSHIVFRCSQILQQTHRSRVLTGPYSLSRRPIATASLNALLLDLKIQGCEHTVHSSDKSSREVRSRLCTAWDRRDGRALRNPLGTKPLVTEQVFLSFAPHLPGRMRFKTETKSTSFRRPLPVFPCHCGAVLQTKWPPGTSLDAQEPQTPHGKFAGWGACLCTRQLPCEVFDEEMAPFCEGRRTHLPGGQTNKPSATPRLQGRHEFFIECC